MPRRLCALFVCLASFTAIQSTRGAAQSPTGDSVVLVTLDGVRTEEMFGGLDLEILKSTLGEKQKAEETTAYQRFWAPTREERRRKLMPFLWSLVTEHGSIAGDTTVGSAVRLRNRLWFSYPGYAEILLGEPHDAQITSNDPIQNPYRTVLEVLRDRLKLPREKVATFASWSVFNAIVEHTEGATYVNAGVEEVEATDADGRLLNALQTEITAPWDHVRFDALTFRQAMRHVAAFKPRVLYLAFDETDDWAHDRKYDRVLNALARIDGFLGRLWKTLQSDPAYRGRTHLLITTDHGRGRTGKDWNSHGAKVVGAEDVWIAFASPKMSQRGVWQKHEPLSTSQIAATLAGWMGVSWQAEYPNAGLPIR
jgi:hypothetical protein